MSLLISLAFVAGVMLLAGGAPRRRRPRLATRLDPYLRGLEPARSRLLDGGEVPLTPFAALERLVGPALGAGGRRLEHWLGGSAAVARRLRQAGLGVDVTRFRTEQALWGVAGFAAAVVSSIAGPLLAGGRVSALGTVACAAAGPAGGIIARDWWLGRQVERRLDRMVRELPALADLLCLAVTAGEGPRPALERIAGRARGALSGELSCVLADLRAGEPFATAMGRLAARAPVPQVVRFVDGMVVAMERGTPLADVLRAQAADVREQRKRELIEVGGRKEVLMLVPVVFLIMPVVVLFALYPGFLTLSRLAR